jgi:hypothetical protein
MSISSFAEVSSASSNAMLSAKVSKAVRSIKRGGHLDPRAKGVLSRGAELLSEIVQGSLLVDRKPLEQGFRADLEAYRHALSALGLLHNAAMERDVTPVFQAYRDDLLVLSRGGDVAEDHLDQLTSFFGLLGEFFFRDVQKSPPPVRTEPVHAAIS